MNGNKFNIIKSKIKDLQIFQHVETLYAGTLSSYMFVKVVIKGVYLIKKHPFYIATNF